MLRRLGVYERDSYLSGESCQRRIWFVIGVVPVSLRLTHEPGSYSCLS